MIMIRYFDIEACRREVFAFIWDELADDEHAPTYEDEANAMAELQKVLDFVQRDEYYPSFPDKAAYLLCSIAGSQYFSNGNKRLAYAVLLMFFAVNQAALLDADREEFRTILHTAFPEYQ